MGTLGTMKIEVKFVIKNIFYLIVAVTVIWATINMHGIVEALYVVGYISAFILISRSILKLYQLWFMSSRKPIEIRGNVVAYYSKIKTTPRLIAYKSSTLTPPITTWFNCIEVCTEDGDSFKVFESYNENDSEKYSGKIRKGMSVNMRIRKCDSEFFMEEKLFMGFYGIKVGVNE